MSAIPQKNWTAEEYLTFERASDEKHEFLDGTVFAITGANRKHNLIVVNLVTTLVIQLKGRPCEAYVNDMRVKLQERDYVYPDVTVACGSPEFEDAHVDTLLNPTLIIEVLSPSTEQYDRGRKFESYRSLSSLQEYVRIAQHRPHIEHFARQAEETWLFSEVKSMAAALELPSIGCTLAVADIYEKVIFDDTDGQPSED
jgi:Uma2 family endonuclease